LIQALANGFEGEIFPVNPNYRQILGRECYATLAAMPHAADLVVVAVANAAVEEQLRQAIALGCRSATIFGSGYLKDDTVPLLTERVAALARAAGMPVCGANCMGFYHPARSVNATWYEAGRIKAGPLGLISHSGSLFASLAANDPRVGYSLLVSPGQELVVTAADYLQYMLEDESTRAIGLFVETVRDPVGFIAALEKANGRDIPVVAMKVGRTAESARLARSHSGAIAGDDAAYEALFDKYGVLRVATVDELMDTARLLSLPKRAAPGAVAAVLDSGGARGLFLDLADDLGVPMAKISSATENKLRQRLEYGLEPVNPVDAWGTGDDAVGVFRDCLQAVVDDPGAALGILMTDLSNDRDASIAEYAQLAVDVSEKTDKPIIVAHHWTQLRTRKVLATLDAAGVATIEGTGGLLLAIRNAFAHRDFRALPPLSPPPGPDPVVIDRWRQRLLRGEPLDEAEGLSILGDFGIAHPGFGIAASAAEAAAAVQRLGFPIAMKTAMAGIHHKSEVGGVHLGLSTAESAAHAYQDLASRLGPRVLVSRMAKPGVELALGLIQDSQFGPVVMVGAGGTLIEVLKDRRVSLPPLDTVRALRMLEGLRLRPLLSGYRGRPAANLDALADSIAKFSLIATTLGDLIAEFDVNPLVASAEGAIAVDALVLPRAVAVAGSGSG
jgi:acyl-CoA synthetase (NDP forming)